MSQEKWKFGSVIVRTGDLHYMVKLDDERIWKRHVNQIRKVGSSVHDAVPVVDDDDDETENEGNSFPNQSLPNDSSVVVGAESGNGMHVEAPGAASPNDTGEGIIARRDSTSCYYYYLVILKHKSIERTELMNLIYVEYSD